MGPRNEQHAGRAVSSEGPGLRGEWVEQELVQAFLRLARGDFAVRLERNYRRDTEDTLAYFVNLIAEEVGRMVAERDRAHEHLETSIAHLSEKFIALAAGQFDTRAERSDAGDPIDVLAYLFNNTAAEVEDAFQEIDRRRAELETILESMVEGVLLLTPDGIVQRANAALCRLLHYSPADLVRRHVAELLTPSDRPFGYELRRLVESQAIAGRDVTFQTAEGNPVPLVLSGAPFPDPEGGLAGLLLVARDERQLRQVRAQLQMADRLATMGTIAAGVAHEINNPLAYVVGNLDFIAEELADFRANPHAFDARRAEELDAAVASSRAGAQRVRQIVADLKSFARAGGDAVQRIDVNSIVDSAVAMIRNEVRHHAQLVRAFGTVPHVMGNEGRLLQVFLNVIQNAAQAIPPGDVRNNTIRLVSGTDARGWAFVEIHDTGAGISPENLTRIFDAFYTTKPVGVGTGLGLSICRQIIDGMGGTIAVRSQPGAGSTFTVSLPPAAPPEARADVATITAPRTRRKLVLVIDDEIEVSRSVARILGRDHDVDTAPDGAVGLQKLRATPYDVVLCDVMMPDMTGVELYTRIENELPQLLSRLVFITGGAFGSGIQDFLERTRCPRLDKPFDTDRLRSLVSRIGESD